MPDPNEQTPVETTDPTVTAPETPAAADTPAPEAEAPKVDPVDATMAAMLGAEPAADDQGAPLAEVKAPEAKADTPAEPEKPAAEPAKPSTPDEAKAKVDAEIAALGIKNERTAARFHELSARAAEVEPLKAQVAQLEVFRQRAVEWEEAVTSTGATPEQFGQTMTYLQMLNSGDPKNFESAFEMIEREYHGLAKLLGKTAGGAVDPLEGHPDLQAKVASLDMDRETALAWAEERNKTRLTTAVSTTREQQTSAQREQQQGLAAVAQLGEQLRATDPNFRAKFAMIQPLLETMQATYPPSQWAGLVKQMWDRIPAVPVPAQPQAQAKPTVAPLRPSATTSQGQVRNISDPVEATMAAMMGAKAV